jgi:hypothetical protein
MSLQILDNIIYPFSLPGKYTFKNKKAALSVIKRNCDKLDDSGWFNRNYPADDPNCQELAAAINYYIFGISNRESNRVKRLKIRFAVFQNKMFIEDDDKLTLKGICRSTIRKDAALKLNLVRKENIFKPLLIITEKNASWHPELKYLLEEMTSSLPRTLQTFVQLPNLVLHRYRYNHLL